MPRRNLIAERLVRALGVVFLHKPIEAALLAATRVRRRPRRGGFEHAMKLLVGAILIGPSRRDVLEHDAQAEPRDIQLGEAGQAGASEWRAVVAANAVRQPKFGEHALDVALRAPEIGLSERATAQRKATRQIAQR
jgi:hypothetical protein